MTSFKSQYNWEFHETIDSTSNRARDLALDGCHLPIVVSSNNQTAGRGRGNNTWWTGEGSIAASIAIKSNRSITPYLSILMAVTIMETLSPQLAPHKIGIRWPNDLFLKNKKFTGILTESPTPELAVIGFGVNLNNSMKESPKDMQNLSITTIFDVLGKKFDREEILELIIECFLERFDALQVDYLNNRRILIETLRKNCIQIGTQTTVKYGDKTVSGKCLDIAEDGRMVLDVDGELQYIH